MTPVFAPIRPGLQRLVLFELHETRCGTNEHKETDDIYAIGSSYD
jgi:hypothetical protein